ncbi:MAG: guanylate kinase [Brumimicrobium sp.]
MKANKTVGKCIIFSAPSGAGKTTIVNALIKKVDSLEFSISACSRPPRGHEENGRDYYFIGIEKFKEKIKAEEFIEWEEVYPNHFYGTLKKEVERLWEKNKVVIFDVDVYGGKNLKDYFQEKALSFFVLPPSMEELERRLRNRQTETEEKIQLRLNKSKEEIEMSKDFDIILINDNLELTIEEAENSIKEFLKK